MTKYILNSGGVKNQSARAAIFFKEMIKGLGQEPRILSCSFAEKREDWEEKFAAYQALFLGAIDKDIKPKFTMAVPDKFVQQIKDNDVIVLSGGDDNLLLYWLRQYNLPEIWQDKVVATSSASSNALAKYFWTCDWRQCLDGLGILPLKFLPHYKSGFGNNDPRGPIDWSKAYQELSEYGDKTLPIYALEEGEFIVIEK
jgi:peptidase E